jgi:hypothetical protein
MKNVTWNYLNHNFNTGTRGNNSRLAAQPGLGLWTQRRSWAGGTYSFDPVINGKIIVTYTGGYQGPGIRREAPGLSLLIAGGVGLIIGAVLRRR